MNCKNVKKTKRIFTILAIVMLIFSAFAVGINPTASAQEEEKSETVNTEEVEMEDDNQLTNNKLTSNGDPGADIPDYTTVELDTEKHDIVVDDSWETEDDFNDWEHSEDYEWGTNATNTITTATTDGWGNYGSDVTILVYPGTYNATEDEEPTENFPLTVDYDGVTLVSKEGPAETTIDADDADNSGIDIKANSIDVIGFTVIADEKETGINQNAVNCNNLTVDHSVIEVTGNSNESDSGVVKGISSTDTIEVKNTVIKATNLNYGDTWKDDYVQGIALWNTPGATISNVEINDDIGTGIQIADPGADDVEITSVSFTGSDKNTGVGVEVLGTEFENITIEYSEFDTLGSALVESTTDTTDNQALDSLMFNYNNLENMEGYDNNDAWVIDDTNSIDVDPDVNATYNYWGSEDPIFKDIVSGDVDVAPWYVDEEQTTTAGDLIEITSINYIGSEGNDPDGAPYEFDAGDDITVNFTAKNNGTESATQTIVLKAEGTEKATKEIALDPGVDDNYNITWQSSKEIPIGLYNLTVESENDYNHVEDAVDILGFEIRNIQTSADEVWTGEEIIGNYTVVNTAKETAYTRNIEFYPEDGSQENLATISLNPDTTWESENNDADFTFTPEEIKEYDLTVAAESTEETPTTIHANTTQVEGVGYAVDIAEITPETILYDDTVTVTANITNENPDDTKQQTIDFYVDTIWKDSTDVTISSGDTEQVEFKWTADVEGDHTFEVESEDDSDTEEVKVEEVVDISLTPAEQDITVGESVPYYAWAINKSGEEVKNVTSEASFQTVDHDHSAYWNDNVYTPEDAGNFTIEATWSNYDSHRNTTWVNVATGTVSYVEIDPAANQTLKAGEELNFSADAYDEYDNLIDDNDENFTWEVTIISGESASIDDWGLFSTTEPGDYEVTAEYNEVTSPVTNVTVEPAEVSRVEIWTDDSQDDQTAEPDEEVNFTAEARDKYDNLITDNVSQFEWTNIWEINETRNVAVFNESEIGTYDVTATYNGETSNVISVNIGPYIVIKPKEEQTIDAGEWSNYTAELYDETGEFVEEVTEDAAWEIVEDDHYGYWYDPANYSSYAAGDWTVKATYDYSTDLTLNDTESLIVDPAEVYEVTIDPSKDFSIEAGTEENFTAKAYDEYDNLITDVGNEFSWENTDDWGLFNETETDEYDVYATYKNGDEVTSDTITVKVRASTLNLSEEITIEPELRVIGTSDSIEYTVTAYDIYNNEFNAADRFDWHIEPDAGGSWQGSEYIAQNAGSWDVFAQYEGEAGIDEDGTIEETTYTEKLNLMVASADFAGGEGTADDPYQIENVWQLQNVNNYLDAHFILTSNIDASYTETWNDGKGFKPIGTREDPFTGTFNGDGYEVQELYIYRTGENEVGLFGFTGDEAVIKNVGVTNAEVHGWVDTGGLVGYNRGTIQKSYATGTVTGYYNVGVLAGRNWQGTIEESYSTGTAEGEIRRVGGLVGYNAFSTITDTYSTADATGTATDSYRIGGLVGQSYDSTISYSYAIGSVSGGETLGALVGKNTAGATIEESYANNETTGQESLVGLNDAQIDANSTVMNTTDMTEYEDKEYVNAFFEWDFDTVWTAQGVDDAYPGLQQEINTESVESESDRSLEGLTGYLPILLIIALFMMIAAIYYKKSKEN